MKVLNILDHLVSLILNFALVFKVCSKVLLIFCLRRFAQLLCLLPFHFCLNAFQFLRLPLQITLLTE